MKNMQLLAAGLGSAMAVACTCDKFLEARFTNDTPGSLPTTQLSGDDSRRIELPTAGATVRVEPNPPGNSIVYACAGPGEPHQRALTFELNRDVMQSILTASWSGKARDFSASTVLTIVLLDGSNEDGTGNNELAGYQLRGTDTGVQVVALGGTAPLTTARGPVVLAYDAEGWTPRHLPSLNYYVDERRALGVFSGSCGELPVRSRHENQQAQLQIYFEGDCGNAQYEIDDVYIDGCESDYTASDLSQTCRNLSSPR